MNRYTNKNDSRTQESDEGTFTATSDARANGKMIVSTAIKKNGNAIKYLNDLSSSLDESSFIVHPGAISSILHLLTAVITSNNNEHVN